MKYLFILAIFLSGCQSSVHKINLTNDETKKLDSIQFNKSLASELKFITKQTFGFVSLVNETGKKIPDAMLSSIISFKVDGNFSIESIEKLKKEYAPQYNIYVMDVSDGTKRLIASKLY